MGADKNKREKDVEFYEAKKKKEHKFYDKINIKQYNSDLTKPLKLWNMDSINASLGVTTKLWWEPFFKGRLKNKKILDIGCGNGYHVPYWAITCNDITGIDSSETSLEILSELLKKLGLKAKLKKGFAEDTIINEKFDIINFNNMLHHVESVPKSLANARKMIKDSGYLLIVEPIYQFPFRWIVESDFLKQINPFRWYFKMKDIYYDEEKAQPAKNYIQYINESGFDIVYLKYDTNFFGYAVNVLGIRNMMIRRVVYEFDRFFAPILVPKFMRSFIYVIAKPNK